MNLLNAIAQSVELSGHEVGAAPAALLRRGGRAIAAAPRRAVLQFNRFPNTLDTDDFRNALSGSNPKGDLRPLFNLRQLVDPVPIFGHDYSQSGISTETIYGQIVEGAALSGTSSYTAGVIANARRQFSENQFADMDGTPGNWHPVYAVPDDWCDPLPSDRFKQIDIDLDGLAANDTTYTMIGQQTALTLSVGGARPRSRHLDPQTEIRSARVKYLEVKFNRPWLDLSLFQTGGWHLADQPQGFCSSGRADENNGVLPLLPMSMVLAKEIAIDAKWSKKDQAVLDVAESSESPVFLGPFALNPQGSSSSLQVMCWISVLVPYSPQSGG